MTAVALASAILASALLLTGCAAPRSVPAASGSAIPTTSPSPTPTAACPQVEGAELPPECAPYDPEHSMAQNDRHRERMALSDESRAAAEALVQPLAAGLESLRAERTITADAIVAVIRDVGLGDPQLLGADGAYAFGVAAPAGGCLFGEVGDDAVTVEADGCIMDGGCLPAQ